MSKWTEFRTFDESIPKSLFEAAVFLHNAQLHIGDVRHNHSNIDARYILIDAHGAINDAIIGQPFKVEVAA